MKKLLLILLCLPFIGFGQTDYVLEFNNATQDYVEMTNVSAVIANKSAFSISCWFYPEANMNNGGIIGFRNNTDADFYLLQLQGANNIEARFRNSSGIKFDILGTNLLDIGQWQHLALTYDGSYIRLYKNGIIVDSTAANGTITQTTQSFNLGMLDYQGSAFYLNGRLDEIRLWDVALSTNEIIGWICSPIYLFHPNYNNLMGYWRLNNGQGIIADDQSANGNNGILMGGIQWQTSTSCFASNTQSLTYVPDDNFENYLEANGMGDGIALNDSVFTASINTVTSLDLSNNFSGLNITDLTGISDFITLDTLECYVNQLIALDLTTNTNLTYLNCSNNQLTSLDVSANTTLAYLYCSGNLLPNLDVSANTALTYLNCGGNLLSSIDVSANTDLTLLQGFGNQFTSIDISTNTALLTFSCSDNQLTSLDVSSNPLLKNLYCDNNQLTSLNVSTNTDLNSLTCSNNQFTSLDVSANTNLTDLACDGNLLTSLDLSENTSLTYLTCSSNQLTNLDLRNGNNINISPFGGFNTTNNTNLYCIDVDNVSLSTINFWVIDSWTSFSTNCSYVPYDCTDSLEVTDVIIDNANLTMNIAIYNGYNSYLSMPYIAFTIDANGDTIQQGNMNSFGVYPLDTSWYNYSLSSTITAAYPLTMYFVYVVNIGGSVIDTCILTYNTIPTAITDININSNRKLISIVDVLGRKNKGTKNTPLFYIYDDGTVEKRIVIE